MSRRQSSALPAWFWFIPAFLLALVAVLYWQRDKLPARQAAEARLAAIRRKALRRPAALRPAYVEPDSIPIDLRGLPEVLLPPEPDAVVAAEDAVETAEAPAPDDLKRIEGIGPAIARLLFENDIVDFQQLAETPVERLDEILRAVNLRRLADPGTWPEQARLAAAGDWEGLQQLQATLKGGRRPAG